MQRRKNLPKRKKKSVPWIHHERGCQEQEEGRCLGGLARPSPQCVQFLVAAPAGDVAIPSFAGKDAAAELDIILPLDVIEKYTPNAVTSRTIRRREGTPWKMLRSTTRKVICGWF